MKAPREHLTCTTCGHVGLTAHGRVRMALYLGALASLLILALLEGLGLLALGDRLWALAITIMLASLGLRLLIRGDRCSSCGAPAVYVKRPPASGDEG